MKIYQITWVLKTLSGVVLVAAVNPHHALDHFKGTSSYKPNSQVLVDRREDLIYDGISGGVILEA